MNRDNLMAVYVNDNSCGDNDQYWTFAYKDSNDDWFDDDSGQKIIQYEGDKILKVVDLEDTSSSQGDYHEGLNEGIKIGMAEQLANSQVMLDGWINPETAESDKTYLVWFINEYNHKRVCKATYYSKYSCETIDDDYDDDWYDINDGIYYIPKGWYETNEYDEKHMQIPCDILGIQPLPTPPNSTKGE